MVKQVLNIRRIKPAPGQEGTDGREVLLSVNATHILWQYAGDETWTNLLALSEITGDPGAPGADGDDGDDGITPHIGENGNWYIGLTNTGVKAQGEDGAPGADGDDGVGIASITLISTVGLNKTYRITFTNATTFDYVVSDGADGEDGSPGTPGAPGADGDDGREIQLQTSLTHIQWRYVGDSAWTDLIALSALEGDQGLPGTPGADGREVELQTSITHIQWRYTGGTWINLIALSALKGDPGAPGADGDDGDDGITPHIGENGNWYIGLTNTGVKAQGEDGAPGADGREVEIAVLEDPFLGYNVIKWRYVGTSTWYNIISIPAITGPAGADGADGADGAAGAAGKFYTFHTFALAGYSIEGYYPGFTVDRIMESFSYSYNIKIKRIVARTLTGAVNFELYQKLHNATSGSKLLPSTGTYQAASNNRIYDSIDLAVPHNHYIYLRVESLVNNPQDLSITITLEHTVYDSGGIGDET